MFQMLHSWTYHPSTLSRSLCLRIGRIKILLVLLVFSTNRTHALDLCLVSMSRTHFEKHGGVFNSKTLPSEGCGSTSTNTLSKIRSTPHFELLGKRKTWVTPYQEVQTSRSTRESNDAPKDWTQWEVLIRILKTLNPCRKVKSVVIHIYPFYIPFSLKLFTFLNSLLVNLAILKRN